MQYRNLSNYNRIRVIQAVEKLLTEKGAKILRGHYDKPLEIKCYAHSDAPKYVQEKIEALPVITANSDSLHLYFLLNGYMYKFSFDDNPFFPIHYMKVKVDENGEYVGKRYVYTTDDGYKDTLDIHLCYDNLFKVIDDSVIDAMAKDFVKSIEDYLEHGKQNDVYSERKRVRNLYNNGYHYEEVKDETKCCIYYNDKSSFNHDYIERGE